MSTGDTLSDIKRRVGEKFSWGGKGQKPDQDKPSMETITEGKIPPSEQPTRLEMEAVKEKEEIAFESGVDTAPSEKHPERNEDAFIINSKNGLYGVCDGVGGKAAGEVASHEAAAVINEELGSLSINSSSVETEKAMRDAIQKAHEHITKLAEKNSDYKGMGTTASIMKIAEDGKKLVVAQIGDSRIYRLRAGQLERISPEDSWVEIARQHGLIDSDQDIEAGVDLVELRKKFFETKKEIEQLGEGDKTSAREKLTSLHELFNMLNDLRAQSRKSGHDLGTTIPIKFFRNRISNVLSPEHAVKPNILNFDVQEGDTYLTSSDGIHDNLTDDEIKAIMEQHADNPETISRQLTQASNERAKDDSNPRAKQDDKTAIVVKVKKMSEVVKIDQRQKIQEILTKEERNLENFQENADRYEIPALRQIMQIIHREITELENQFKIHPDNEILKIQLEYKRKWEGAAAQILAKKLGETTPSKKQNESF